jgi:hypothetical protein
MSKCGYIASTGGAIALVAATAKSILGVKAHANFGVDLTKIRVGFDGISSIAVPALVELMYSTWATNAPGTSSTSVTPLQVYGRVTAVGATAAKNWSPEPTSLTVIEEWLIPPTSGVMADLPLANTYDCAPGEGFVIRITAPAVVNTRVVMGFERA